MNNYNKNSFLEFQNPLKLTYYSQINRFSILLGFYHAYLKSYTNICSLNLCVKELKFYHIKSSVLHIKSRFLLLLGCFYSYFTILNQLEAAKSIFKYDDYGLLIKSFMSLHIWWTTRSKK